MTVETTGDRPGPGLAHPMNMENRSSATGASADSWLEAVLSRHLIFVMGKGGVGKTTLSIALAGVARRFNKKVLLVELGDTDAIGRIYNDRVLVESPTRLSHGIWGARVDAKAELEAYVRAHIASRLIAGKITRSRLFDYLFEAAPGLKEVMSLGRLWRWTTPHHHLPQTPFDLIIVDAPASGHALSLLRLPDLLIKMIRVGPIVNQLSAVRHLLKNRQKTAIALVTLPEELPVNETTELYSMVTDALDMHIAVTFINGVYPTLFGPQDAGLIQSLKKAYHDLPSAPEYMLLDTARHLIRRRMVQQKHIQKINAVATCHVCEIPFCFTNDMTLKEIEELSFAIDP